MKRWILLSVIVAAGSSAAWLMAREQTSEMSVRKLADNLFVISDREDGNTAVFIRDEGVVLVDTKSLGAGQRLLDVLGGITTKPVTHILNTHHHYDHVGGNAYFPAHVEVVAHQNAAARMPAMREFAAPERRHGLPDRTFADTLTLFAGADAIDLYHFGAAHTDNDAFIVFRGPGVMHAGDTYPGMQATPHGGSATAYPTTMTRATEIRGVRSVIPGHGPLTDWQAFLDNAAALRKR